MTQPVGTEGDHLTWSQSALMEPACALHIYTAGEALSWDACLQQNTVTDVFMDRIRSPLGSGTWTTEELIPEKEPSNEKWVHVQQDQECGV